MKDILKKVDILDRIKLRVVEVAPGHFGVAVEALEKNKNVIFDTDALKILNEQVTHRARSMNSRDPNTRGFIEEFVGRMISEMYRVGLVELEDIKDAPDDPYRDLRKLKT
jgi:hypothetical protein